MIKQNNKTLSTVYNEETVIGKIYKGIVKVYESWRELFVSGIPPLTLPKCKQANLVDYKVYGNSVQKLLPSEYQEVEYIESTGTQYIDLQYTLKSLKLKVNMTASKTSGTTEEAWFSMPPMLEFGTSSDGRMFFYISGIGSANDVRNINLNTWYDIEFGTTENDKYLIVNNEETRTTGVIQALKLNMYLFRYDERYYANIKLKKTKIYDDNILVRDLIPCYRVSDNVIGMYDLVNGVFYTNAGTGTFLKGNNIIPTPTPDAPIEIESVGEKTGNLFDINTYPLTIGHWLVGLTGNLSEEGYTQYATTIDYIPCEHLQGKTVTLNHTGGSNPGVSFYNVDKTFLSGLAYKNAKKYTFTIPNNAIYMRFTVTSDYVNEIMLNEGGEVEEYEPYGYKIPVKVRGKNYCTNDWEIGYIRQGDGKIEATAGYIRTGFMKLPYIKSYRVTVLSNFSKTIVVYCYDKNLNYIGIKGTSNASTFKPLENTAYVRLCLNTTDINQQIQIEDGTVTTAYEDFKEPIMYGKNMLNPIFSSDLWGGSGSGVAITTSVGSHSQIVKVKPNTNYVISCDNLDTMNDKTLRIWETAEYPVLGGITGKRRNMGNQGSAFELNFTTSEDTNYLLLSSGGTSTTVYDFTNCKIQIEENTTKTSYQSYQDSITPKIYLKEPLRKDGNYTDYIDFETKKVYRNIIKAVLDGTGTYTNADNSLTNTYRVSKAFSNSRGVNPVICDKLKPITSGTSSNDTENIQFSGTSVYIRIKRDRLNSEDVTGVKEYLALNPITFYYVLNSSSIKEETIELPDIQLHKGTNIIEIDTTIQPSNMEVTYLGKK